MAKLFRTFAIVFAALFALSLIVGCGGDEEEDEEAAAAALTAEPASGSIASNAEIKLNFSADPGTVTASAGTLGGSGRAWTLSGLSEGDVSITVTWDNGPDGGEGTATLQYTVTAADTEAPTITEATVEDGDEDVEPADLNDGSIEITFSEEVDGTIALQTEGGESLNWSGGNVSGMTATLEKLAAGEALGNEATYVIIGTVKDAAGNELPVKITFTTAAKE